MLRDRFAAARRVVQRARHLPVGALLLAAALASLGCTSSRTDQCDDGRRCPAGLICISGAVDGCALPEQLTACDGKGDGEPCTVLGGTAVCQDGVCLIGNCGDGNVTIGEACDDGNQTSGDGCAADCTSDETCGNGVVDSGEECDCGDDELAEECSALNSDEPSASCRADCIAHCGDGVVNAVEDCDTAPIAAGCVGFGFDRGPLLCDSTCAADFSGCRRFGVHEQSGPGIIGSSETRVWLSDDGVPFIAGNRHLSARIDGQWTTRSSAQQVFGSTIWVEVDGSDSDTAVAVAAARVGFLGVTFTLLTARFDGTGWQDGPTVANAVPADLWIEPDGTALVAGRIGGTADGQVWRIATDDTVVAELDPAGQAELVAIDGSGATALAIGSDFAMFRTAGVWGTPQPVPATDLRAAVVLADGTAYAGGAGGELAYYDGTGWSTVAFESTGDIRELRARAADDLFAIAGTELWHFDGGSWMTVESPTELTSISVTGAAALASGQNFSIAEVFDDGWRAAGPISSEVVGSCSSAGGVAFVATGSRFTRWDGASPTTTPVAAGIFDIEAVGPDRLLVQTSTAIDDYQGQAGPVEVRVVPFGAQFAARADDDMVIAYPDPSDMHIIERYDGSTWTQHPLADGADGAVVDVIYVGQDIYILQYGGAIHRLDGGGLAFFDRTPGSLALTLWGTANELFVGAENGDMWHRGTDGQWLTTRLGAQRVLRIHGSGPADVMAATVDAAYHFDGVHWSPVRAAGPALYDLCVTAGDVFAAMSDGRVWRLRRTETW